MQFEAVRVGEEFVKEGHIYTKMATTRLPWRSGTVNAHGPSCKIGDDGYRWFWDDMYVEPMTAYWDEHGVRVTAVV